MGDLISNIIEVIDRNVMSMIVGVERRMKINIE
jgi:hypothetical protein